MLLFIEVSGAMVTMKGILVFCSLILLSVGLDQVAVIKALSKYFGPYVLQCQSELQFGNDVVMDLMDFWNDKNKLTSTDLGCAIVCVLEKNYLMSDDFSTVHTDKLFQFYKSIGADDIMAQQLVDLLFLCKEHTKHIKNICTSALELARCYRFGIFQIHWNPDRFFWKQSLITEAKSRKVYDKLMRSCKK